MTINLKNAIDKVSSQMRIFDLQRFSKTRMAEAGELTTIINDTSEIKQYLKNNDYSWTSGYSNLQSQIANLTISDKAKYAEFLLLLSGSTLKSALVSQTGPVDLHLTCDIALKLCRIATSVIREILENYPNLIIEDPYIALKSRDDNFTRAYNYINNCPSPEEFESTLKRFEYNSLKRHCEKLESGTEYESDINRIPLIIINKNPLETEESFISNSANLAMVSEIYSIQPKNEEVPIPLIKLAEVLTARAEEQLFHFQRLMERKVAQEN